LVSEHPGCITASGNDTYKWLWWCLYIVHL